MIFFAKNVTAQGASTWWAPAMVPARSAGDLLAWRALRKRECAHRAIEARQALRLRTRLTALNKSTRHLENGLTDNDAADLSNQDSIQPRHLILFHY
jgi:hypothetical protein